MTDATAKNMMVKSTLSFIGSSFLGFGLVNPSNGCSSNVARTSDHKPTRLVRDNAPD